MLHWIATCLLSSLLLPNGESSDIIGGREAIPHSRPYMALLKTERSLCAGTLIKADWVLTAAHCKVNSSTTIQLGVHSKTVKNKYIQEFKVLRSIRLNYDEKTKDNDIELVQLSCKAKLNKAVKILPLPKKFDDVKDGTVCDTAGWGSTKKNTLQLSDKLMEVSLPAISRKKCAAMWKSSIKIATNMMCTFDASGEKDVCRGDSGGPLICKKMFRGIVSFGPRICGNPELPSVYTFLTKDYNNWIKKEINKKTNAIY
ncbi:granzyme A-like [Rana temporaria]|uniref:granzyme A-like n=1 Tax=Rana temporaria TaxID=8407 RepID=UPI001AADF92E|nr:granzyme A-like [Rana temporaria]